MYNIKQNDDGSTAFVNEETSAEVFRLAPNNNVESGTYASPVQLQAASEQLYHLNATPLGDDSGGFTYCLFSSAKAQDSSDNIIGIHNTSHVPAITGTAPKTVQAIQGHAILDESGSKIATRGGDTTAGMYGAWFKIGSAVGSELESGSYAAAIWLDNQLNGTKNGTTYSIYSSSGATTDAWAGFADDAAGWTNLFKFEGNNTTPVSAGGSGDITFSGDWRKIAIDINGTTFYLVASASPA